MVKVLVWPLPLTVSTTGSAPRACEAPGEAAPATTTAATASSARSAVARIVLRIFMLAPSDAFARRRRGGENGRETPAAPQVPGRPRLRT